MDNQQESFVEEVRKHPFLPVFVGSYGTLYNLKGKRRSPYLHRSGYLRIDLKYDKIRYYIPVHRAVAETFLEPPSKELIEKCSKEHHRKVLVLHKDNNRFNNHFENLKWGTHQRNISEAFRDGLRRSYKGGENPSAVLTESIVRKACEKFQAGKTRKEVREELGLTYNQVYFIHTRRSWGDVTKDYNF